MQHILLSLCLAATLGVAEARNPSETGETIPVIISPETGDPNPGTRGPVTVPISCYVDSSAEYVFLYFTYPCGMVPISFSNLSDGSYYSTSVNGSGPVVIPLALTSGSWTVTFTLPSGDVYLGEFSI